MLLTILFGFIASCLIVPFGRILKTRWAIFLASIPFVIFIFYLFQIPVISSGDAITENTPWIPSLGVGLDFRLDGLSLLFVLLISGIGTGIFIYAYEYLKNHEYRDRFFGYLLLFMSSMLGLVLSDNIILTFIFWELTSISSFFLIGFNNNDKSSRKSALVSLTITGLGGFFLLAAFSLIGKIAGTYSLSELIALGNMYQSHSLYPLIVTLLLLGAFTKSAQFPFHFWLPGAMKAPTPVSAYLHSATMVKAGVFLIARFTPVLGNDPIWNNTLLIVGGFTMLYSILNSLYRTDLKEILAYSTISVLGMLVFLLGLGTREAFIACLAFILAHALYKATLFMVTGIIDLKLGTRDITQLSGLGKVYPIVAIAAVLAAFSSAGLPSAMGFISKDLIYDSALKAPNSNYKDLLLPLALLTNIGLVAAGFMAGLKPFTGENLESHLLDKATPVNYKLWIPPFLLAILSYVFGIFPNFVGKTLIDSSLYSVIQQYTPSDLKLWHGWNLVFILSLATLIIGFVIYVLNKPRKRKEEFFQKLYKYSPQNLFSKVVGAFDYFSLYFTNTLHNGYLRSYIFKIILFVDVLLAYMLIMDGPIYLDYSKLSSISVYEIINVIVLCGALIMVIFSKSRLTAVVATSVVGYTICLMFVFYSAPDLAMTQFSIDTLTVVLFVFVLFRLPPFLNFRNLPIRFRDSIVAIGFGAIISLIALKVMQQPFEPEVRDFYATYAYALAKGKNVVNVILVDFRGIDTMFEIVVLSISALGVYSLLKLRLTSSERE